MRKISLFKFVRDTHKELQDTPLVVTKNGEPYVEIVPFSKKEPEKQETSTQVVVSPYFNPQPKSDVKGGKMK